MSASEGHSTLPNVPTITEVEVHTLSMQSMHTKNYKEDLDRGIQLDPVGQSRNFETITEGAGSEKSDEIVPLAKPLTTESSGRLTSQGSMISDQESRKGRSSAIVRMVSSDSTAPPSTPKSRMSRRGTGLSRRKTSLFRRDSGLSLQESWRKKDATVRLKSSNNFVSFHNVNYTVPQGYFWQHKPPKVILNNVR